MTKANILIVDDELESRKSLKFILQSNYAILVASNGIDALEMLKKQKFTLVTLDLSMPFLGGIEFLKKLRTVDSEIEVVIITGHESLESAKEAIKYGVAAYITKPFNIAEVRSSIKRAIQRKLNLEHQKKILTDIEKIIKQSDYISNKGNNLIIQLKESFGKFHSGGDRRKDFHYLEFVNVLANTLEGQDSYTHGHSERVNYYSSLLADELSYSKAELEELQIAAFLHDIGKLGISNNYILKRGSLTKREKEILNKHPQLGVELLSPLKLSSKIISVVKSHHERYDGNGYPDRIKGNNISVSARIVMIADAFDAMISDRPYRKALPPDRVKQELKNYSGTQFDPTLVTLFLKVINKELVIA